MSVKQIKKDIRQRLADTLHSTFDEFHAQLSPKKLKRNIKRASKDLLAGIKVAPPVKKSRTKKKPIKKADKKKEVAVSEPAE